MGLFDILGDLLNSALENQTRQMKGMERKINEYERKMGKAEANYSRLSEEQKEKLDNAREKLNNAKAKVYGTTDTSKMKSIDMWDREWICIGKLETADLTPYNKCVGIYRHVVKGKTMYVGRAIELNNGGFRKRLSDYRRPNNSARKHTSGRLINEHLSEITTFILIVGDDEEAVNITKRLEGRFIERYNPEWNKVINI